MKFQWDETNPPVPFFVTVYDIAFKLSPNKLHSVAATE